MIALLLLLGAAPPTFSPEERTALAARSVVARADVGERGVDLLVAVEVAAPPDRVLDAALDPSAFVGRVRGVSAIDVYERGPDRVAARVQARALGLSFTYHAIFVADRAAGVVRYALDPSRPNDLDELEGVYEVYPRGAGTLLVNRASGHAGGWVPAAVRERFILGAMREKNEAIRVRAEGG